MNRKFISGSIFCLLFLYCWPGGFSELLAQERINILNSERGEVGVIDGEPVRKLIGNVRLSTESMVMECDSAWQFQERNMIQAFNIEIETDDERIWADTLYHNTLNDYSRFRGRVVIESDRNTLFSESIDYDRILDVALFLAPVRFEDNRGSLLAESGYYFERTDIGFFEGDVQLADTAQYLEADSLFMNRESDFYQLFSRVYVKNFEDNVTFAGDFLEADSTGYRLLEGNSWMMQVNDAGTDTTHLNAETILLQETDTASTIDAFEDVRLWSPSYSAIADTAYYRSDIEEFQLISNPIAWQKNIQLTGPYIETQLEDDQIKFLESYSRPIAVQEDSVTGRFNQMTGDTLHAYFDEGDIQKLIVFNNSELIFHQKDENDEPDGLIELIAGMASTITFEEGEPAHLHVNRNIDGSYLPEDPENIDRRLSGFRWDPELRPARPEIRQSRLPILNPMSVDPMFEFPPRYQSYLQARNEESNRDSGEP
ncbi:MAG: OstA-like protein [Balneolaceae bacterium]